MNCPVCSVPLVMTDRQGVEIDYCPKCRGVWLDRGELDKIIDRAAAETAPREQPAAYPPQPQYPQQPQYQQRGSYGYGHDDDRYKHHRHPHKKKSLLGELFDFD